MGIVLAGAFALYLLISIGVVTLAVKSARQQGANAKGLGWTAALVMYLIPFWDLLPTIAADQYNCARYAGLFVYKTVDRWKELNPGVFETLSLTHLPEDRRIELDRKDFSSDGRNRKYRMADGTTLLAYFDVKNELMFVEYKKPDGESGYQLNERFRYTRKTQSPDIIKLSREEYVVTDIATDEVLARQVNFKQSTKGRFQSGGEGWWKFWLQSDQGCSKDKFPDGGIHRYINSLRTDCIPIKDATRLRNGIVVRCQ